MTTHRKAFFALAAGAAFFCGANMLTVPDTEVLLNQDTEIHQILGDIAAASKDLAPGAAASVCMSAMVNDLTLVSANVEHLRSLVAVASVMVAKKDEAFVLNLTKSVGSQVLDQYATVQAEMNHLPRACSASKLVNAKAQRVLDFLDQAIPDTKAVLAKIR